MMGYNFGIGGEQFEEGAAVSQATEAPNAVETITVNGESYTETEIRQSLVEAQRWINRTQEEVYTYAKALDELAMRKREAQEVAALVALKAAQAKTQADREAAVVNLAPVVSKSRGHIPGVVIIGDAQRHYVRGGSFWGYGDFTVIRKDGTGSTYKSKAKLLDSWEVVKG